MPPDAADAPLWRVRTTLADRPGTLAALTAECGRAGVNILRLQVFPGAGDVTDELVLGAPADWDAGRVRELLERAGGHDVLVARCTAEAMVDQPTRYVDAARAVLAQPASFPDVVAHLFDADAIPSAAVGEGAPLGDADVMDLAVGEVQVQIRRLAPFTDVERARGSAMADLVGDVLGRARPAMATGSNRRMGAGASPEYVPDVVAGTVTAVADGVAVGVGTLGGELDGEPGVRTLDITVDPGWQRRGIGTRLLSDSCRLARGLGSAEVVLSTDSDNRAVMPMVLAAGMRGRIRMAGETLTVRIGVAELRPLT